MAKIEVNKILASSRDNFLVFSNDNFVKPYVTIYFKNSGYPFGELIIKDALNDDGYSKTIVYSPDEIISDSSFRCRTDKTENTFALLECLRKNNIFYDISLVSDIPNVGIVIRAYLDSSTRYSINGGSIMEIGGNYNSYVPKEPNKFVLMLNDGTNQVMLDKYTTNTDVSFNVTAPYEHLSFKNPKQVKMVGYHIDNNTVVPDDIANNSVYVFPTTLPKFSDVNLSDYWYNYEGQMVKFLTNNYNRYYNYGEVVGLSLLTDKSGIGIVKQYYTVSGKYLYTDTNTLYTEDNVIRKDFYFTLDIDGVEAGTNKQVGYVEVFANRGGEQVTKKLRFNITPKCNENHEIFFVNELGGIDSFNFLGESKYKSKIKSQKTYMKNPTRAYGMTKELEIVSQKVNDVDHVLNTTIIDSATAKWLNEMSKSKYPFLYLGENGSRFERIIITDLDISLSDRENVFEVELTYKNGDNSIKI
jgi:hypothetical protein